MLDDDVEHHSNFAKRLALLYEFLELSREYEWINPNMVYNEYRTVSIGTYYNFSYEMVKEGIFEVGGGAYIKPSKKLKEYIKKIYGLID